VRPLSTTRRVIVEFTQQLVHEKKKKIISNSDMWLDNNSWFVFTTSELIRSSAG